MKSIRLKQLEAGHINILVHQIINFYSRNGVTHMLLIDNVSLAVIESEEEIASMINKK